MAEQGYVFFIVPPAFVFHKTLKYHQELDSYSSTKNGKMQREEEETIKEQHS